MHFYTFGFHFEQPTNCEKCISLQSKKELEPLEFIVELIEFLLILGGIRKEVRTKELYFHSSQEWENIKDLPGSIIVDVYTEWAGPCDIKKPIISQMNIQIRGIQAELRCQIAPSVAKSILRHLNKNRPLLFSWYPQVKTSYNIPLMFRYNS